MLAIFRSRFLRRLVVLTLLLLAVKFASGRVLKSGLIDAFAEGTGCRVNMKSAELQFFPPVGTAEDVSIVCPSDKDDGGFHIRRLRVILEARQLLSKIVFLRDLHLEGTWALAHDGNGAFFKTLGFVLAEPPPASPQVVSWYKRPFHGWAMRLNNVLIVTDSGAPRGLDLEAGGNRFSWRDVSFASDIFPGDKTKPADSIASAKSFVISTAEDSFPIGAVDLHVLLGGGKADFRRARLMPLPTDTVEPAQATSASGKVSFAEPHALDFQFESALTDAAVKRILGSRWPGEGNVKFDLRTNGLVTGDFEQPKLSADLEVALLSPLGFLKRPQCSPERISGKMELSFDAVRFQDLAIDDIVRSTAIDVAFDDQFKFAVKSFAELDANREALKRCFGPGPGAGLSEGSSTDTEELASKPDADGDPHMELQDVVGQSSTELTASGTLVPLLADIRLSSEVQRGAAFGNSHIEAKLHLDEKSLSGELKERDDSPQFERRQLSAPERNALEAAGGQTPFQVQFRSGITMSAAYEFDSDALEIKSFEIERYGSRQLLARVAPFLSEETLSQQLKLLGHDSYTTARGSMTLAAAEPPTGKLQLQIENLSFTGPGADSFTTDVELKSDEWELKNVTLQTPGGGITGAGKRKPNGTLSGLVSTNNLNVHELGIWQERFGFLPGVLNAQIVLSGTDVAPSIEGTLGLRTQKTIDMPVETESEISLTTRGHNVAVHGHLFNRSVKGTALIPLPGGTAEVFEVQLQAENAPLDILFPLPEVAPVDATTKIDPNELVHEGALTGKLNYKGRPGSPLSGDGKLEIETLKLRRGNHSLENRGPLIADIRSGKITFTQVRIETGGRDLQLLGSLNLQSDWDARLVGAWEIGSFIEDFGGLEQVSGMLTTDLRIQGEVFEPRLTGALTLVNGSVSVPLGKSVVGVSDVSLEAKLTGTDFEISQLRGHLGNGDILGSGAVRNILSDDERTFNLAIAFDDADLEPIDKLHTNINGKLLIAQSGSTPVHVSGELSVASGVYENTVRLIELLKQITQWLVGVRAGGTASLSRGGAQSQQATTTFDLHLTTENPLLVETNIASLELTGDLRVKGTNVAPIVEGKLESNSGTFGLQAKQFELLNGVITFSGQDAALDPRLDILGETALKDTAGDLHQVRLSIGGTLVQPKITFSSDTGLPSGEIVSLLGLGSGKDGVTLLAAQDGESHSILELLNPLSGVGVEDRLTGITGFSEVQIAPSFSSETGEFAPRFIARRPVVDPMGFEVETALGDNPVSSMRLYYPLTPEVNLFSGWRSHPVTDPQRSAGSFGAGFYFRRSFPGLTIFPPDLREDDDAQEGK